MNKNDKTLNLKKQCEKKSYTKPILRKFGKIKIATLGGSFDRPEGGGVGNMFKMP